MPTITFAIAFDFSMTRKIDHLFVYPVKSLGGFGVKQAAITAQGFEFDRRFMLIDENNRFISQREIALMALFDVFIQDGKLKVVFRPNGKSWSQSDDVHTNQEKLIVQIWSDECLAIPVSTDADAFFSEMTGRSCKLVWMPDSTKRLVDEKFNRGNDITSFSDGFPFLLIGSASLSELNNRLMMNGYHSPLGWDRFRPNIVVQTEIPFEEDHWKNFVVNGISFDVVKPCARCVITTTDQQTALRHAEPLKTLSIFRTVNNKVMFGQNLLTSHQQGEIHVGDEVEVVWK